ncbi:MAG: class I SAM-dependent methyltransferase [Proteobacteria bacterium]|nr:class I SAM-dependent methyltransferase [Pseudomonadota bacterium]
MSEVDQSNTAYWDEPCGTTRLDHLGYSAADSRSPLALKAFDEFFFAFYPYLERLIPFPLFAGKDVLEVGLGMGSVSQRIAMAGGRFVGLDIAQGPVDTVNTRMIQMGFPAGARTGSILNAPFPDNCFDYVVSLGCLHHTGDLPRAIAEVHRVLRKGGSAFLMLYYAYSPKRWLLWPLATGRHLRLSRGQSIVEATASERAGYDRATDGGAPPETVFTSKRQLRAYAKSFESISITLQNLDTDMLLYPVPRRFRQSIRPALLKIGDVLGFATEDMYATLRK